MVIGEMARKMVTVSSNCYKNSTIMVLLCSQSNKVSVFRCLLTETNIKESTMEENSTERASTCGLTVHATKVNSIKE